MITYIIIAITVIISIIGFSNRQLFYNLSLNPYNIIKKNQWHRLITHAFLHGDYTHLFVNMFVLWSFGTNVERIFKALYAQGAIEHYQLNYVLLYLGAVVFSSLPDLITKRNQYMYNSIGASGAVSAILFASIFFNPWGTISLYAIIPIPSIVFGICYVWYETYLGKKGGDNINHFAHLWGALYGVLFVIAMKPSLFLGFISALMNPNF